MIAFTSYDLRQIAKRLDQWERRFFDKGGDFRDASDLVNRIEVHRPHDSGEIIGHFAFQDASWLGFEFLGGR